MSEERYTEARGTQLKIEELVKKEAKDALLTLKSKHKDEQTAIEKTFQEKHTKFDSEWDTRIQSLVDQSLAKQKELTQKHQELLQKELERLEATTPDRFKPSPKLLELKRFKQEAARNDLFESAEKLKEEIELRHSQEYLQHLKNRKLTIKARLRQYEHKLKKEAEILEDHCRRALEELKKERAIEYEQVLKRFANVKRELVSLQRIEFNKVKHRRSFKVNRSIDLITRAQMGTRANTPMKFNKRGFTPRDFYSNFK